jgi:hypothetical protein
MFINHQKKFIAGLSFCFVVFTGTYNAVVINSESDLSKSDVKFVKRLDEVYGVVKSGREVAASISWQKLEKKEVRPEEMKPQFQPLPTKSVLAESSPEASESEVPVAAVQEELNLRLVEVVNTQKYKEGLNSSQYGGELLTNNGVIESLSVALPNGEGVSVSFSEMTGNVFEYDLNGEIFSGMMYQVDQNSYMVTLTNGPLEGTRLKFQGAPSYEEQYQRDAYLAENHQVEVGNFGQEDVQPEVLTENYGNPSASENPVAQGYDFDQSAL